MRLNELAAQEGRRHRHQFSLQFKTDIVAQCQGRGVSVAAVARQIRSASQTIKVNNMV